MADRGNVQRRGASTDFISQSGQYTTGFPPSTGGDSYLLTGVNYEGSSIDTFLQSIAVQTAAMPPAPGDDGYTIPLISQYLYVGATSPTTLVTPGGGGTALTTYYKMQGFYTVGSIYETWISIDAPSNTNPNTGHSYPTDFSSIAIIAIYTR